MAKQARQSRQRGKVKKESRRDRRNNEHARPSLVGTVGGEESAVWGHQSRRTWSRISRAMRRQSPLAPCESRCRHIPCMILTRARAVPWGARWVWSLVAKKSRMRGSSARAPARKIGKMRARSALPAGRFCSWRARVWTDAAISGTAENRVS
jgi:hypothetical protein